MRTYSTTKYSQVPESHKRYINMGSITKPCNYCGKPMTQSKGRIIEILDKDKRDLTAMVVSRHKMNDQRVLFHKICRKKGRQMIMKQQKLQRTLSK